MVGTGLDQRLRSGFAWLLSGNVLYSACQWGIVWVLARLGTTEDVGQYALGMAVCAPILLFANGQLRLLVASDLKREHPLGQYLSFRFATLAAAMLAIAVTATAGSDGPIAQIVILVGVAQAVEFISETYYGAIQREERLDRLSRSLLMKGPLALGALAITMWMTHSLLLALSALVLARVAVLLLWDSRLSFARRDLQTKLVWNRQSVRTILRLALPLASVSMLVSVNANVPRYFLEGFEGSSTLGIFAALASFLTVGALVISALGQSLFVPVAQAHAARDVAKFRSFAFQAALLGGALGLAGVCVAAVFGETILRVLFGPEYSANAQFLTLLMVSGAITFVSSSLGYILTAARSVKPQIPLLLASTSAGVIACLGFIPTYGLMGAAGAMIVAALVQLGGTILILWRIDHDLRMTGERVQTMVARAKEAAQ